MVPKFLFFTLLVLPSNINIEFFFVETIHVFS
uniref:Uncharacterized protein n=1 Tax=Arundo donax TaxID=35708 RepID=A0A0A8Z5Q0_ARUDO